MKALGTLALCVVSGSVAVLDAVLSAVDESFCISPAAIDSIEPLSIRLNNSTGQYISGMITHAADTHKVKWQRSIKN